MATQGRPFNRPAEAMAKRQARRQGRGPIELTGAQWDAFVAKHATTPESHAPPAEETVSATPDMTVVRFTTPMGFRYVFICREGHRHEARHECANCNRDTR
jgi:hypothetical protein